MRSKDKFLDTGPITHFPVSHLAFCALERSGSSNPLATDLSRKLCYCERRTDDPFSTHESVRSNRDPACSAKAEDVIVVEVFVSKDVKDIK